MIKFVIKKNGDKIPYNSHKVKNSILYAAKEAGLDDGKASALASQILGLVQNSYGQTDTVSSLEMKDKILARLDASHPEVSRAWRDYDKAHGK